MQHCYEALNRKIKMKTGSRCLPDTGGGERGLCNKVWRALPLHQRGGHTPSFQRTSSHSSMCPVSTTRSLHFFIGFREKEGDRNITLLFHLVMHSSVTSCTCPALGSNPQSDDALTQGTTGQRRRFTLLNAAPLPLLLTFTLSALPETFHAHTRISMY